MGMRCRGIRGAITVEANDAEEILEATTELLTEMLRANALQVEDVASAFFTTTRDLNAEFPALAARDRLGWDYVALLCAHEMDVPGSMQRCLRILLLVNTEREARELQHVYLRGARKLRPDLNHGGDQRSEANTP
ncbi:MAG: chorismate mutase [Dehalococcoidia bacterium]